MQNDKSSLLLHGKNLRQRAREALAPSMEKIFLSLHAKQKIEDWNSDLIIYDRLQEAGPVAGLLAAHEKFPGESWFVLACDFPWIESDCIEYLIRRHRSSDKSTASLVTCYQHMNSTAEPLFAIWTPQALEQLKLNFYAGKTSPRFTLHQCKPLLVRPVQIQCLFDINTPQEWEKAVSKSH
jgi:molybdopterin-guanine dinucleotide biosynthesis protein A